MCSSVSEIDFGMFFNVVSTGDSFPGGLSYKIDRVYVGNLKNSIINVSQCPILEVAQISVLLIKSKRLTFLKEQVN